MQLLPYATLAWNRDVTKTISYTNDKILQLVKKLALAAFKGN